MEKKTKDFIFSFVLAALAVYVTAEGYSIYTSVAQPPYNITRFTLSPGFLPVILGVSLFICSLLLFFQTLKGNGTRKQSFILKLRELHAWIGPAIRNRNNLFIAGGIVLIGLYTYVLMGMLPFWLASLIFLVAVMLYLKAARIWKVFLIAGVSVALIIALFQVCFNASLP